MKTHRDLLRIALLVLACGIASSCANQGETGVTHEPADLVLRNGKIVTVDESAPEARAIAIRADRIVAVGSDNDIDVYIGDGTEVIDLEGQLAIPGFIEGHGHFMGLGYAKMNLDLTTARTWDDIVEMVGDASRQSEPGAWIQGRGWHQEKWDEVPPGAVEGLPHHMGLSEVSPENPVILEHASGHAAFANAKAMELAGIDKSTPDPAGGTIVKGADDQPTGALRETAQRLVRRVLSDVEGSRSEDERRAEQERAVALASAEALNKGVTSFQDAGSGFSTIAFLKDMASNGKLPLRLYLMVRGESNDELDAKLAEYKMTNGIGGLITVRSIKRQIDGALGPHGAWLLEPYEDKPDSAGLVLEEVDDIAETARIALKHGYQVNTHAIGDRGNRETLDIYQQAFEAADNAGENLRWRIEHAQHLHPDDIPRFAEMGVIASMQGVHCTSDAPWVYKRLGAERAESGAYMWRALLDSGAIVTNGTDVPVEDINPLVSFYASVSRKQKDGEVFFRDQAMTREEALYSYTMANAYAAFEEDVKGSITTGKYADIVVLSKDILTVSEEAILETEVVYTIVGGKIRNRRGQIKLD